MTDAFKDDAVQREAHRRELTTCPRCGTAGVLGVAHDVTACFAKVLAERDALRARLSAAEHLPNGWAQPTFLNVDDDGALNIEWCFGSQGSPDSWRVMFVWQPDEGVIACRTTRDDQGQDETLTAGRSLATWLNTERDRRSMQTSSKEGT